MSLPGTCPGCAAPFGSTLLCDHCGHDRAPTSCALCFHRNPVERSVCEGCGADLGLEPVFGPSELRCPECFGQLRMAQVEGGCLFDCHGCGGQLLEHGALAELLRRAKEQRDEGPPRSLRAPALPDRVRYLGCPVCQKPMNRKNFASQSGVIVDVCREHGTFFHRHELPRIAAFVRAGGLELAAERAHREANETRRQAAAQELMRRFREANMVGYRGHSLHGESAITVFETVLNLLV